MIALGVSISLSLSLLIVPTFAAGDGQAVSVVDSLVNLYGFAKDSIRNAVDFEFYWVNKRSAAELDQMVADYNKGQWFSKFLSQDSNPIETFEAASALFDGRIPLAMVGSVGLDMYCPGGPAYRPCYTNGSWIVDKNGNFPYCPQSEYENAPGHQPAMEISTSEKSACKWIDMRALTSNRVQPVSYDVLSSAMLRLNERGVSCTIFETGFNVDGKAVRYYVIGTPGAWPKLYCNSSGEPYVAAVKKEETVVEQSRPPIVVENKDGDKVEVAENITHNEDNSKVLDLTNGKLTLVDELGSLFTLNIDDVSFDFDNRTYTVNAYDIKQTNNYYEFNYYTYNIQYTYNNTYVTYIGSTAEYQPKEWALYYELPDGRSSADLTEEDIAGLSFQFNDVVNYKRSATDTSLRALYHFDGNTNDSSFFSTQGAFTWNTGASITYMESNAFNGALYLDEKTHDFTVTLPSNIGSGDFTLQWRYYQNSATTSTHNDNYVTVGGQKLIGWSEHSLYNGSGTKVGDLSVGTWQELALVRNKGTLYLYHNGVKIGSVALSNVLTNKIAFRLGPNSKAYAMMDELRFVNFAIAKGGTAYTPTAVPYDTNSVLVLPDGAVPVADEYWKWDTTITPTMKWDLSSGFVPVLDNTDSNSGRFFAFDIDKSISLQSIFRCSTSSFSVYDSFCVIGASLPSVNSASIEFSSVTSSGFGGSGNSGLMLLNYYRYDRYSNSIIGRLLSGTYTFSIVLRDGSQYSAQVAFPSVNNRFPSTYYDFGPFRVLPFYRDDDDNDRAIQGLYLGLAPGRSSQEVVYMELVPGSKGNTGHEFVTAIYDANDLQPNTAAVQSDIPVKGYTVGGVRPTFPERGDVWFPVEGSRISGVYIYNGQAWEATNARWWTGKRWIPIYAFDLVTLQDCWDVTSSEGPGTEVTPPITSDYSFWNWWKQQWLDFRAWLEKNLTGSGSGGTVFFPPIEEECDHTYREKIMTRPSCTLAGTALYTCSKCGDTYTAELDALGHDWVMDDSVPDELDEEGNVLQAGYDLYTCTRCGVQHKDYTRAGPPGSGDSSTITELIQKLFDSLGNLVGGLIDWVLDLAKEAIAGFGSLGDYFKEKAEIVQGFGGEFVSFFGEFFELIPPELEVCISLALVFLGLGLFIREVLM